MSDVDAIIEQILAASRAKGVRAFASDRVYADEPILVRGSQLATYQPERIREMRALRRSPEARSWSDARLFVEQARLMADYEDDFPFHGTFQSYFPTYDAMSDRQLRGYFAWRTRVRAGTIEHTSASFAYVYLYELINGIGVEAGEQGLRAIESFWREYREHEPSMDRYVLPWLVDYVVYYGLDPDLARPYLNVEHDRAVDVLAREEARALSEPRPRGRRATPAFGTDPARTAELLDALDELSTYRVKESALYRDEPDALREVACAVFDELARYYRKSRAQGLVESLFGTRHPMPHLMFASAVFYPDGRHPDATYDLGGVRQYSCRGGIWSCTSLHDGGGRSARLGQALRAADRALRDALGYPHPLKEHGDPKYLTRIVTREATDFATWHATHAPVRVEIDLTKLSGIRVAAAETREALLVDEEREEETPRMETPQPALPDERAGVAADKGETGPAPEPEAAAAPTSAEPAAPTAETSPYGLTPDERALLADLLAGRAPSAAGTDLLVDSINEKLFDLLGDTAIEFGETGAPALVEDYVEDVRAAFGR